MCFGLFRTAWCGQPKLWCAAPGPAAFWSWKLLFLLLCNDASSPCQYFNALIDVTSLIVPNNLKWAFKHSYWNIDVLAVCLNHWLQGAVFPAVISGDNLAKTRLAFPPPKTCRNTAWIQDCHAGWYSASQLPHKIILRSSKQQFPVLLTIPCWRKSSPQGLTEAAPFSQPITPTAVSSHSWVQGFSLPRAAKRLLTSEKQCHESPGHVQCPRMAHGWNQGSVQRESSLQKRAQLFWGEAKHPQHPKSTPRALLRQFNIRGKKEPSPACPWFAVHTFILFILKNII